MTCLLDHCTKGIADRVLYLHPIALEALCFAHQHCTQNNLRFMITSTVSTQQEDLTIGRVSDTHSTRRAWDISSRGWTRDEIETFKTIMFARFRNVGATARDGSPRPIVHHDAGYGLHFHFQIARKYALRPIT
jgi:hypothetical protein